MELGLILESLMTLMTSLMTSLDGLPHQARDVVLGLLHGSRQRLLAAWSVFVPAGEKGVLGKSDWRAVLGLITGGMGLTSAEADQLFSVFDQDGNGVLPSDDP